MVAKLLFGCEGSVFCIGNFFRMKTAPFSEACCVISGCAPVHTIFYTNHPSKKKKKRVGVYALSIYLIVNSSLTFCVNTLFLSCLCSPFWISLWMRDGGLGSKRWKDGTSRLSLDVLSEIN
mmetsp:Transcript_37368/g.37698  ORF Transcript_37368/g.37698 Transcript_37368/m.37698 type:complete len:121 (-) Transcript_37368:386-748(-)